MTAVAVDVAETLDRLAPAGVHRALARIGRPYVLTPGDAGASGGKPVQGRPKLEKASLTLYDPSPPKSGKPGAKRSAIAFQFNPKEVTIAKTAS